MSEIENTKEKEKEKKNQKIKQRKILTKQNSPVTLKNQRYLQNNSFIINSSKNIAKKSKKKYTILNEEKHNISKELINCNNKKKEKELKMKNIKSFSPHSPDETQGNLHLLQKLKNIQIKTKCIKDELKKYKKYEKNFVIKQQLKYRKKNNLKVLKNTEINKNENDNKRELREMSKKKEKNNGININVNNDNKLNLYKIPYKNLCSTDKFKKKNIVLNFSIDLLHEKYSLNTNNNNKSVTGSSFIKYNELNYKNSKHSKSKKKTLNKSTEYRKKTRQFDITPNYKNNKENIIQYSKSRSKIKNKNLRNDFLSASNKNKNLDKTDRKKYKTNLSKKTYQSKIHTSTNSRSNININIKTDRKDKDKSFNNSYNQISRSIDKMEKKRNTKYHESREKQISYEVICQSIHSDDITNEKIQEKPKEKEIIKIEKLCKKGYLGDGKDKQNQDNYFIYTNFNNDSNNIYMGVCDGHGDYGHEISSFIVTNLPLVLGNFLRIFNVKDISLIDSNTLLPIVVNSFTQVNQNLYSENNIDSQLSGSTCSSLIYTPKKVFCINIGDSRCIIGQYDGNNWKSEKLSNDHKPQLVEEKERIEKNGGIIRQSTDEKGEFVGPHRVYVKNEDIPGLAMTRSFGDEIAHQIGVICEPEIIEYELNEEDKFIILASDGLWEVMTNQECIDIVKDFYINENYKGAIKHLYQESCKRWLDENDVIDDITLIIVFFK